MRMILLILPNEPFTVRLCFVQKFAILFMQGQAAHIPAAARA